ncbi:hypothetical protein VHEMI02141 [[Torrubiella] hemipterigena]|nr:hypothetical protein VHEMI02141 [[Torrubiella] hemipterigena]
MAFSYISIIFISIIAAGCTTTGLKDIYLISLSYTANNTTNVPDRASGQVSTIIPSIFTSTTIKNSSLEVRVAYFGLCLQRLGGQWICSSAEDLASSEIDAKSSSPEGGGDPLNLIYLAEKFRKEVVFVGLLFTSLALAIISIFILRTYPSWFLDYDSDSVSDIGRTLPGPTTMSSIVTAFMSLATMLAFVAILWQHLGGTVAATMYTTTTYGAVAAHIGVTATALGWVTVFAQSLTLVGISVIRLTRVL